MQAAFLVFVGGGLGAVARHGVNVVAGRLLGTGYPWGTFAVNVAGSFLMGALVAWLTVKYEGGQGVRLFLATGVLGGFTTFSSFSLDAVVLWERGAHAAAAGYVAASLVLSVLGLVAGLALVRAWA